MDTTITVQDWRGGHANVGLTSTAPVSRAPMTKLAPGKGGDRRSADGRFRYTCEGHRCWFVFDEQAGELVFDERFDSMHLGFTSLAEARRHTATIA